MSTDIPARVAVLEDWRETKDKADEKRDASIDELKAARWRWGGGLSIMAIAGSAIGSLLLNVLLKRLGG